MALQHKNVLIGDVNIHYVEASPAVIDDKKAPIVFLHGFPEFWQTWQAQLDHFSEQRRVIAPDLPGYNLSDKPKHSSFYDVPRLAKFINQFIARVNKGEKVILVAHDWGGAIAWPLVAFFPELIEQFVVINAAHPSTFTRELMRNPKQRQYSEYIHDLIADDAVQKLTDANFTFLLENVLSPMEPSETTTPKLSCYIQAWQQPGAIDGMLSYYRAMPQLTPSDKHPDNKVTAVTEMKIPNIRINVPTLVLWGEGDEAFVVETLDGLDHYVPDLTVRRYQGVSHWVMHEISPEVNKAIEAFISPVNVEA